MGRYRMRTLANPQAPRQPDDVIRHLKAHRLTADDRSKRLIDAAVAEADRYKRLRRGSDSEDVWHQRLEVQWGAMLSAFDAYLEAEHERWRKAREPE